MASETEYEKITGGKKLTWKQYMKKKAEYEEKVASAEKTETGEVARAGVCDCGHKSFRHRIEDHQLIRVCPACRRERLL